MQQASLNFTFLGPSIKQIENKKVRFFPGWGNQRPEKNLSVI